MIISIIAAMGNNRVIGNKNDIPWNLPDDFKYFKDITKNHHVIMGRKNWESLPTPYRPLPSRTNIIITRQSYYRAEGGIVVHSLENALEIAKENGECELFIIGGGDIYRLALDKTDKIYLTEIHENFEGDVTFPKFSQYDWKEISRKRHQKDDRHVYDFDFVVYVKK